VRELTDIELEVVSGGVMLLWMNTVTKYINNVQINAAAVAQQNNGWQGFGNFSFVYQQNVANNQIA
jgi:hypothetical protein